jgi:hypothetical protein
MFKPLAAPLLAGAIALSPIGAAPARADGDLGKVVAGIALLAIIGTALQDRADAAPAPVHHPHPAPGYGPGYGYTPPLPAQCKETIREHGRDVTIYGKACLKQHMRRAEWLPGQCERKVEIFGNPRSVYGAQCLRRLGWPA